ncbi:MAG: prepilin-type N-terminal cleavage/methylation domain-containing protein [Gammaproteobacteria bacterium]|nr:prepilin-type N-terminal cleavage/methylation domain-containing protein [Gammaproteobacteria bacterium]
MMTLKPIKRIALGFTLVELIVVVVLLGVMATASSTFILKPIEIYVDVKRRQELVDNTEMAFRRISRDIHRALPNSLRVSTSGTTLEIINTVDGARYRNEASSTADHTTQDDILTFAGDTSFNTLGTFDFINSGDTLTNHRLVIYNTSTNIYAEAASNSSSSIITPSTTSISVINDAPNEQKVTLSASQTFPFESPNQRFFLINQSIVYVCNVSDGTLYRYTGTTYIANQANNETDAQLTSNGFSKALVTQNISSCTFTYSQGASSRSALVTLEMSLSKKSETINLLHEVHVINAP